MPWEWELFQAARWMHLDPEVLAQKPSWWMHTANIFRNAEVRAQNILNRNAQRKGK